MRVLISGGGTGGHVYPALAVAEQLGRKQARVAEQHAQLAARAAAQRVAAAVRPNDSATTVSSHAIESSMHPADNLLWIGSVNGMERDLVARAGIPYRGIETGQLRGISPLTAARNAGKMVKGLRQSLSIVQEFQPDVCLTTGGYVCAPVIVACRLRRIPVLIYLPDMTPGWSIRAMSLLARCVAVSFPEAARYFGGESPTGKAVVTGYPVRSALVEAAHDRFDARKRLGRALGRPLDEPLCDGTLLPLLLAFGGSQGARSLNKTMWDSLEDLLPHAHILHIMGMRDWPIYEQEHARTIESLPAALRQRYHPTPYLHEEMVLALAAADVAISRAGASTLGEFPVARLPSILVPLPFAGVNQQANAQTLASRGAAMIVEDAKLATELTPTLMGLLKNAEQRQEMKLAMGQFAQPEAAARISMELAKLANVG